MFNKSGLFRPILIGYHQAIICNKRHKRDMHKIPYLVEIDISILQNTVHLYVISMNKNKLK
jgi:hypothetical protein